MGCFMVPATEALVITVARKAFSQEKYDSVNENIFVQKLKWLSDLLWGGSVLLIFEHVWHGEVVPYFPFFTAAYNHEDFMEMLHEMATRGTAMAILITVVWIGMVIVEKIIKNRGVCHDAVN